MQSSKTFIQVFKNNLQYFPTNQKNIFISNIIRLYVFFLLILKIKQHFPIDCTWLSSQAFCRPPVTITSCKSIPESVRTFQRGTQFMFWWIFWKFSLKEIFDVIVKIVGGPEDFLMRTRKNKQFSKNTTKKITKQFRFCYRKQKKKANV